MKNFISLVLCAVMCICLFPWSMEVTTERVYADGFNGSSYEGSSTETITYFRKDDQDLFIKGALPKYYEQSTRPNTCANVAGAVVLGYYDKIYDELISDFSAARIIRDRVLYAAQCSSVQKVIDSLYEKMETNTVGTGTTAAGFRNGLQNYVNEKGRNILYTSVVNKGELNIERYKQAIKNEKPLVLFVSKYTLVALTGIESTETSDTIYKLHYSGDHVLIAYGIREICYYDTYENEQKQLILLQVSTGYNQDALAYVMIDGRMQIIEGYEINIY